MKWQGAQPPSGPERHPAKFLGQIQYKRAGRPSLPVLCRHMANFADLLPDDFCCIRVEAISGQWPLAELDVGTLVCRESKLVLACGMRIRCAQNVARCFFARGPLPLSTGKRK